MRGTGSNVFIRRVLLLGLMSFGKGRSRDNQTNLLGYYTDDNWGWALPLCGFYNTFGARQKEMFLV